MTKNEETAGVAPVSHLAYRLRLHADDKTKIAMQRDGLEAAAEIERLGAAIDKALIQISGGLCYFNAESKHAQLKDAQKTLTAAMSGASIG